jgi:tRNA 2-selenouridine synthase
MAIEKLNIEKFLELANQHPVIDVRSPGEYDHAHIPGAYNLPLFTDEERKIVGTTYKQESREQAIKIGLDFFGPKMRPMVEEVEKIISNRQQAINNRGNANGNVPLPIANCLLLYCWRGGMRSAGVAWLMDLYGFKVYTLAGGYKRFRNHVLDTFKLPFQFKILGGYTGSGKTEMLKALENQGEFVIDLEDIAKHKGSAFGKLGMIKQPTQEMFENLLAQKFNEIAKKKSEARNNGSDMRIATWLEDESQRIGDINIPHLLWRRMRQSPVYFLEIPFEERLKHIVEEYSKYDKETLLNCIGRIKERLGGLETKNAIAFLNEDNYIESFRILLKYYDKWYLKSLHNREDINSLLSIIPYEKIDIQHPDLFIRQIEQKAISA